MSSRDQILKAIALNKPDPTPLPEKFKVSSNAIDLVEKFLEVLNNIGGKGNVVDGIGEVKANLKKKLESGTKVVNASQLLGIVDSVEYQSKSNSEIENVHTFFLEGSIAVAENAAIWVGEKAMGHRLLPFVCQELVMVIRRENIVANMHDAYEQIDVNEDGFGVFIAGPSKTADIEQSLVIGAHGPLSLSVFIT